MFSRWWFQISLPFPRYLGKMPILTIPLQPSPSDLVASEVFSNLRGVNINFVDGKLDQKLMKDLYRKIKEALLLLMEEILHHLGCMKPCRKWDILHINW